MATFTLEVTEAAIDPAIVASWIVERPAIEPKLVSLRLTHGVEQLEGSDIRIAARGYGGNLRIQQFLLGIEHVEHGARADASLRLSTFQREFRSGNRNLVRRYRTVSRLGARKGRARQGDHSTLGGDGLLKQLALKRLCLSDARRG